MWFCRLWDLNAGRSKIAKKRRHRPQMYRAGHASKNPGPIPRPKILINILLVDSSLSLVCCITVRCIADWCAIASVLHRKNDSCKTQSHSTVHQILLYFSCKRIYQCGIYDFPKEVAIVEIAATKTETRRASLNINRPAAAAAPVLDLSLWLVWHKHYTVRYIKYGYVV